VKTLGTVLCSSRDGVPLKLKKENGRPGSFKIPTVKSGNFDGFLEVFWIFLKNEHDKPLGTPNRAF